MDYDVRIEEVIGGHKVLISVGGQNYEAFAPKPHMIPARIKDLFEVVYPKPEKKS